MPLKTQGVRDLVQLAIVKVPSPYTQTIIEDVCLAIEGDTDLRASYDVLCNDLRTWVVNNWIGQWTKAITGMDTIRQVDATRAKIIGSFSLLKP